MLLLLLLVGLECPAVGGSCQTASRLTATVAQAVAPIVHRNSCRSPAAWRRGRVKAEVFELFPFLALPLPLLGGLPQFEGQVEGLSNCEGS